MTAWLAAMPYWPEALSVSSRFFIWFVLIPALLMPRRLGLADRVALGFSVAAASGVVVVQILSGLRVYDPFALWGLLLGMGLWALARMRKPDEPWERVWVRSLDRLEDSRGALPAILRGQLTRIWAGVCRTAAILKRPEILVGAAILIWSAWLRFHPYLEHSYLGAGDAYLNLTWAKYIERHEMFRDGIYPFGYHAIAATLGSLTFLDRFLLFRFLGPIGGMGLLLSVTYATVKLQLRPAAVLAATALVGLGFSSPLPADSFRQAHPLVPEFAVIFFLPGLVLAWQYFRHGGRAVAGYVVLMFFLMVAIYPYAAVFLLLAVVTWCLVGVITRTVPPIRCSIVLGASALASALAALPLFIGWLLGKRVHSNFAYFIGGDYFPPPTTLGERFASGNSFLDGGALLALLLLIWGATRLRWGRREEAAEALGLGTLLLVLFTQAYGQTGLPVFTDPARAGLVFSLVLAVAVGWLLDRVLAAFTVRTTPQAWVGALLSAALVLVWWPVPAASQRMEYEDAIKVFQDITRGYPRGLWTIVGPVEQYPLVLDVGWHQELGYFVTQVDPDEATKPDYKLYISTPDIFVYIEKIPLYSTAPIEPDINAPIIMEGLDDPEIMYKRYKDPTQRRHMEERAWAVVELYRQGHPNEVTIYFESDELRVYRIHHEVSFSDIQLKR